MIPKLRICIAAVDVAYQFRDLERAFEDLGHSVTTVVLQSFSEYIYTHEIAPRIRYSSSIPIVNKCVKISNILLKIFFHRNNSTIKNITNDNDIFIFIWHSFDHEYRDLEYLHKLGKKIIFIFVGDDARWHHGMRQDFIKHGITPVKYENKSIKIFGKSISTADVDPGINGLLFRLKRIRAAEKYADLIFSKREQAQLQLRPFYHFPMYFYPPDFKKDDIQKGNLVPIVVHAPTNQSVKGTKFVFEAFDRLKKEGIPFLHVLVTGMSHQEALKAYINADIIIDQLFIPGGGKLSTEGLALGKVVMANMSYNDYPQGFHSSECPIVDVNPENLYDKLKDLLIDTNKRQKIADKGKAYAAEALSVVKFCERLVNLLQDENGDYDFYPDFFRSDFIPESDEAKKAYNQYTQRVKDTKWYSKHVKPGNRDGLVF
ncbi:MAG: hypothetical protein V3V00_06160 [Saprospiraceae bacterium]